LGEKRIAGAQMDHGRTTEIAGKEDGCKDRAWREGVEDCADKEEDPD